jgi:hypothetical protein
MVRPLRDLPRIFLCGLIAACALDAAHQQSLHAHGNPITEPTAAPRRTNLYRIGGVPILKSYDVPTGNADAIALVIQTIYEDSPRFRIKAVGQASIMVYAPEDDHKEVVRMLLARRIIRPR